MNYEILRGHGVEMGVRAVFMGSVFGACVWFLYQGVLEEPMLLGKGIREAHAKTH